MKKITVLIFLIYFVFSKIYSQEVCELLPRKLVLTLNASLSDEFNTFNQDKWLKLESVGDKLYPENVLVENSILKISYTNNFLNNTNNLKTGGIISKTNGYHYGYYEARYKLPHYMRNGQRTSNGLYEVFWLNYDILNPKAWNKRMVHDEIDQFEGFYLDPLTGHTKIFHKGIHILERPSDISPNWYAMQSQGKLWETIEMDLTEDFHNYGMLYLPNKIHLFIDGYLIYTIESNNDINNLVCGIPDYNDEDKDGNHDYFPIHPMNVYFNGGYEPFNHLPECIISCPGGACWIPTSLATADWPENPWTTNPIFEIDYFRYYEYKVPSSLVNKYSTSLTNLNDFKINNPRNGVYNNVTINPTGIITLPAHTLITDPVFTNPTESFLGPKLYDPYTSVDKNYLIRMSGIATIKPITNSDKFIVPRGSNFQIVPTQTSQQGSLPPISNCIINHPPPLKLNKSTLIKDNLITVSPNPATTQILINSENLNIIEYQLISLDGLLILDKKINSKTVNFNIEEFSKGCYILKIILNNNEIEVKKIILK